MDNYIVSARKYRPSTFASVVGQKALTSTLKNAIATDRLAHAYLFCGSRGVGKTSCARIFAKAINCEHPSADGEPCNECDSCRTFNEGRSLNITELDAASNNSVDDIRALVEQVQVPPTNGRYRVFIVDEVHMLSAQAFNAFLKTLEEPPSYVIFILATTEKHKIIPTILSRCQIYDFNRITVADMVDHLEYVASKEGISTERAALNIIARKADGAMRDALSIFDQVAASSRGQITYASTIANLNVLDSAYYDRLMEAFMAQDVTSSLLIYKEIRDRGFDSHFFVNGLASYLRDLMVARTPETTSLLDTDEAVRIRMAELAARVPIDFFFKAMSLCNDADLNYRQASSKTFLVELLLIKLCQLLSPSPTFSGDGEGQLKPFAASSTPLPPQAHDMASKPAASNAVPPASSALSETPARHSKPAETPQSDSSRPNRPTRPVNPDATAGDKHAPTFTPSFAPATPNRPTRIVQSTRQRVAREETPKIEDKASSSPSRRSGYTLQQLEEAWDSFAASHSKEHVLANCMRACRPKLAGPDEYDIAVQNDIQLTALTEIHDRLLRHLHDALLNDNIRLSFSITDEGPSPLIWNDRELLAHLMENPRVAKFITDLNLKIL